MDKKYPMYDRTKNKSLPVDMFYDQISYRVKEIGLSMAELPRNKFQGSCESTNMYFNRDELVLLEKGHLTEMGAFVIAHKWCKRYFKDLLDVLQLDILTYFKGNEDLKKYVYGADDHNQLCPDSLDDGLYALPPNCKEPFIFNNGVIGISSLAFTDFLNKYRTKSIDKGYVHKAVLRDIRKTFKELKDMEATDKLTGIGVQQREYYDLKESTYFLNKQHANSSLVYITHDLALIMASGYNLLIRHRLLSELHRLTNILNDVTDSDIDRPTLSNMNPDTGAYLSREIKISETIEGRYAGYMLMSSLIEIYKKQTGKDYMTWCEDYLKKGLYSRMRAISDELGYTVREVKSKTTKSGYTKAFHVCVYEEVFTELDLSHIDR